MQLPAFGQQTTESGGAGGQAKGQELGAIVVSVTYGRDGRVQTCRLLRSNAPFEIELSTIEHIRKHWACPFFAGDTEVLDIAFDDSFAPVPWNNDTVPPPDVYPYDRKKYSMKLRLTFGGDGWVKRVQVIQPSGIELADAQTADWIQAHWHHDAYANKVVDVPFEFSRALPPAPPPPVIPVPAKPDLPEQQVAIPAIRVQ